MRHLTGVPLSKPQLGEIARLWRFANGDDDGKRANHKAATESEHEQQPDREARQLDHAFANETAAARQHVGDPAS